jgi:hypothetical protein
MGKVLLTCSTHQCDTTDGHCDRDESLIRELQDCDNEELGVMPLHVKVV